ncbi:MAG: competence/damage-inducible protein A [Actinobacteria bacterium]|nr:competence/damage-inducible protein A [Actinomycetota bacterium]
MALGASIVVIGDEILEGFVQDTNSWWLAGRLRHHGIELARIVAVGDDVDEIVDVLGHELLRERPRVVFTTGGIGSTPDDVTYEAVAAALDVPLQTAGEIERRVEAAVQWTAAHGVDVDDQFVDHMMRMARIPAGGSLLGGEPSSSPGVRVDVDDGLDADGGAVIVILPGVPAQLRAIVTDVVEPQLLRGRGRDDTIAEIAHGFPESLLNRCFARLAEEHPQVKVGSYPGVPMIVRLRGEAVAVAAAVAAVEAHLRELEDQPGGARLRRAWSDRLAATQERL